MTSANHRRKRSVDGILSVAPAKPKSPPLRKPLDYTDSPAPIQPPVTSAPSNKNSFLKKSFSLASQTALFVLFLGIAIVIQSPIIGQLFIAIYAVAAFVGRIRSRTTFFLVILSLLMVLLASVRSDVTLASTFAMYAFFLLVIGTISLAVEVRNEI